MNNKFLQIFILCLLFVVHGLRAELPNGSTAEDWTLMDLNGNSHHLYPILESGKPVVLDFSATWCGPCWNYHNTGILEELWDDYGPSGNNTLRVFFIESELANNTACLYGPTGCTGPNGGTQGDWVTGTGYPIIDLNASTSYVKTDYNVNYYPTLYAVSPDKRVWEVGQASKVTWERWLFQSFTLEVDGVAEAAFCAGQGSIDLSVSGGYGSKTYQWSNGASTQDLSGLDEGVYSVNVYDQNGYFVSKEFILEGPESGQPLGIALDFLNNVSCNGNSDGEIQLTVSGGNYGYTYAWDNGQNVDDISNLPAGTYNFVVTDDEGCTESQTFIIDQPEVLTTASLVTPAVCNNNNGTVSFVPYGGTGPFTYDIGGGPSSQSYFVNLSPGIYQLTVEDDNGCLFNDAFQIDDIAPVAVANASGALSCIVTQVTVSGSGSSSGSGITYSWTTTNGNIVSGANSLTAIVNAAGTYTLHVMDGPNNCMVTEDVVVTSNALPPTSQVAEPADLTCTTTTVQLDGSASASGSGITYQWTTADGNIVSGATEAICTVNAVGTYTLTVSNANNGCTNATTVTVEAEAGLPVVTSVSNGDLTCTVVETTVTGTVNGDPANYTIVWSTSNGNIVSGGNTLVATVNAAGNYTMTATNNTTGCAATTSVTVNSTAIQPAAAFNSTQNNGTLVLNNTSNVMNGDNVSWNLGNGATATGNEVTISFPTSGTYTICQTVSNDCGSNTSCSEIVYYAILSVQVNNTPVRCFGENNGALAAIPVGGAAPYSFAWTGPNGYTSSEQNIAGLAPGVYVLVLTDANSNSYTQAFIMDSPAEIVSGNVIIVDASEGLNNGSITLEPSGGTGTLDVVWSNGATGNSITDLAPGMYTASASDANACMKNFGPYEVKRSVSVIDLDFVSNFVMNPNPASDLVQLSLTLNSEMNTKIRLINNVGQIMWTNSYHTSTIFETIDVSDFTAGIYLLEVSSNAGRAGQKLILVK